MSLTLWILFATVALAAILTPGPAVFLAISNSMAFGWRRVAYSSLGNITGLLTVSALAAHAARTWFTDQRRCAWFNRVSGCVFFLLGAGMLRLKASRG